MKIVNHRQWIDTHIFIKINYPASSKTIVAKKKILPSLFKEFLNIYCKVIKKKIRRFPTLKLDSYKFETMTKQPNNFFSFMYTQPYNNHPFVMFGDITKNYLYVLVPLGGDKIGQISSEEIIPLIKYFTKIEKLATSVLINRTIEVRRKNIIINPQFSLLKCENIRQCRIKLREINKNRNMSLQQKKYARLELEKIYLPKASQMLLKYFDLLTKKKYDEAFQFLKGGKNKRDEYYGKQRLDTFFMSSRKIIGHLQVFINLYKLYEELGN
jgi:hypothetical protein